MFSFIKHGGLFSTKILLQKLSKLAQKSRNCNEKYTYNFSIQAFSLQGSFLCCDTCHQIICIVVEKAGERFPVK